MKTSVTIFFIRPFPFVIRSYEYVSVLLYHIWAEGVLFIRVKKMLFVQN